MQEGPRAAVGAPLVATAEPLPVHGVSSRQTCYESFCVVCRHPAAGAARGPSGPLLSQSLTADLRWFGRKLGHPAPGFVLVLGRPAHLRFERGEQTV